MLRKIYRKIFPVKLAAQPQYNLVKGENCIIDPSSSLITAEQGKIILAGDNYIGKNVEIGTTGIIEIGSHTSLQDRCIILGDVEIGNYCTFAPNIYISSGRHYYNFKPNIYIKDQDEMVAADKILSKEHSKKVTIGDDCWLGINSVIMSGITIGRGCVIGANSVVTKNLEPFSVVAGSPAKLIKTRLDFIPKTLLNFNNENDLPNFYKGFFIDLKSLKNDTTGIAATNNFLFYLKSDSKKIVLTLKKTVTDTLTLAYNNQEIKLDSNDFTVITFNSDQTNYHKFVVKEIKQKNKKCLLIKSVEILN
ncbi:MAG: DapH/DapD/GlmU-related protein [Bacteroidota bacterium]|nr:DapH/DapD/GlmU-related protein [Bacteroidota bacterium]MDP3145222.1 DapH/DapD/GlmU-related protein [Bacteroidota bacterium]